MKLRNPVPPSVLLEKQQAVARSVFHVPSAAVVLKLRGDDLIATVMVNDREPLMDAQGEVMRDSDGHPLPGRTREQSVPQELDLETLGVGDAAQSLWEAAFAQAKVRDGYSAAAPKPPKAPKPAQATAGGGSK